MQRIYLDYAATTPVRPEALEAMLPFFGAGGYNPSSVHAEGRTARAALDDARERVARVLGAKPKEIVFTGSGSEADNLAIAGVARAMRTRGRHIVSVVPEHTTTLHTLPDIEADGWNLPTRAENSSLAWHNYADPTGWSSSAHRASIPTHTRENTARLPISSALIRPNWWR